MKKTTAFAWIAMLAVRLVAVDDNPNAGFDARRLDRELPRTWDRASLGDAPRSIKHIQANDPEGT